MVNKSNNDDIKLFFGSLAIGGIVSVIVFVIYWEANKDIASEVLSPFFGNLFIASFCVFSVLPLSLLTYIVVYLLKNERANISKVVKEGTKNSKFAELDYEVLKYDKENNISLVKVNLHTGRHHQIRVQFASRNHAIYGDQKYGSRGQRQQICLWAYSLTIKHPISKDEMNFICLPEEQKTWKILSGIEIN